MGARPSDKKVFDEEVLRAYKACGDMERIDDSATTMRRAYSKSSGGKTCFIPVLWDMGCSKNIISEKAVKGLGIHIEELGKSLNIILALCDSLSIIGVAYVFIKTQVTGPLKKMIQCCVLKGNKQSSEIQVTLERMKALRIIHPTFGTETIEINWILSIQSVICRPGNNSRLSRILGLSHEIFCESAVIATSEITQFSLCLSPLIYLLLLYYYSCLRLSCIKFLVDG